MYIRINFTTIQIWHGKRWKKMCGVVSGKGRKNFKILEGEVVFKEEKRMEKDGGRMEIKSLFSF
jgi:translation initiation factor IF-1